MDEHTLRVLEFDQVRQVLSGYASSELGRKAAMALLPATHLAAAAGRQAETSQMRLLLSRNVQLPLAGVRDIEPAVRVAAGGASYLDGADLSAVNDTLAACGKLRRMLTGLSQEDYPNLVALGHGLGDFAEVVTEISRCIDERGAVADAASPQLASIRSRIATLRERLQDMLKRMLNSSDYDGVFNDQYICEREGRYVLPVSSTHRGRVDGIVHDRSSRGGTLFIEPAAAVPLGNELRERQAAEEEEVERILWELTKLVGGRSEEILGSLAELSRLDLIYAKACYSIAYEMSEPILRPEFVLGLRKARHPLLTWLVRRREGHLADEGGDPGAVEPVVPIDVSIGASYDALVITGPNTGGKTVAIKTVGLCVLMAESGLHVPAAPGSEVGMFAEVFADIGDEQSLQQSLSTFSAHMVNIRRVTEAAAEGSLVLLDELGGGTDPAEGAALGEAVLDRLLERGAKVIVSTHLGALKAYGFSHERAENASVEFDAETLRPTFRLVTGVPGNSNALVIAEKLGLAAEVMVRARELLRAEAGDAEELIMRIQDARAVTEADRRAAEAERERADALRAELAATVERTRREGEDHIARVHKSAYAALSRCRDRLRGLIAEAGMVSPLLVGELEGLVEQLDRDLRASPRYRDRVRFLAELSVGDRIGVRTSGNRARVAEIDRERGRVVVVLRGKQVTVPFDDVVDLGK